MRRRLLLGVWLALLVLPAAAHASDAALVISRDCEDHNEHLTKRYTQKEYRQALADLPPDLDQYSNCRSVIQAAQLAAASAGSKGGGPGGETSFGDSYDVPAPADQAAVKQQAEQMVRHGGGRERIADVDVDPGSLAYHDFSSIAELPTPLIALALLLVLSLVVSTSYLVRGRVRSHGAAV